MKPREEWHLDTRRLGRRVLVFDRLDSTNTLAATLADDPANDGLVVLADQQSAGRGQHGRTWQSPVGEGVWLSVLTFPPAPLRRPVVLAAWAAVAVCRTVERYTGRTATIKWPNDVLVDGRKVCGILIEQARGTVAGIGLNVRQSAETLAAAGLPVAGSLAFFSPLSLDVHDVARQLIQCLDQEFDRLCRGDVATLEAAWKEHSGLLDQPVVVETHDALIRGRLVDLRFDGVFLDTREAPLRPEMVRHVRGE